MKAMRTIALTGRNKELRHLLIKEEQKTESKGIEKKITHANGNGKTAGIAVLIQEKIILYKRQT